MDIMNANDSNDPFPVAPVPSAPLKSEMLPTRQVDFANAHARSLPRKPGAALESAWNLLGICLDVPMVVLFIALTSLTTSRNDSEWCTNCARSCYVRGRVSLAASIQKLPGFCSLPSFLHFLHMPAFCQALNIMKR